MSANDFLRPPSATYNDTLNVSQCLASTYLLQFTSIAVLLPSSICVLYLGFQQWSKRRSSAVIMNHSDFFTYNLAVIDLIGVLSNIIYICAIYFSLTELKLMPFYSGVLLWNGRMFFPTLTCWEHYLAVVHPIKYRRMRQRFGIRIRTVSTVCIWLLGALGAITATQLINLSSWMLIPTTIQVFFFMMSMLFCSLSVLYVLVRPRPGEMGGDRMRIHHSKQRAFCTILVIMGVLFLKFGGSFVSSVMIHTSLIKSNCLINDVQEWFALPSSLVLPLLFLRQQGKLPGCKH